jgi:hypothetical protein
MKGMTIRAFAIALAASASVALGQGTPVAPPRSAPSSPPGATSAAASGSRCALHGASAASMKADACLACHGSGLTFAHPVDRDYDDVRARRPSEFRMRDEVTRHGVPVPEGQVRCVSCHDARSPWAHYLLLPSGADARAPFDARRPGAAEGTELAVVAKPGEEVSSKPLCLACHVY